MSDAAQVVFVDDDDSFRQVMGRELQRMGFSVTTFPDATGVRAHVANNPPDAVVLDLRMPGEQGLDLLDGLLEDDPGLQVIVLTGHGSINEAVTAMRRGAFDFLTKPVSLDILEQTLLKATDAARLRAENRRLRLAAATGDRGSVPLTSPAARRLEREIERIGPTDASTLVSGESGVGKELVARQLHAVSPRAGGPFVAVNCAAIPVQLMESELFGHRRGAFTGADARREGLFEVADGGTLFLDEIGELPAEIQPALLRALQFGEIRPVGSDATRSVNLRVVAATNRDLRAMVDQGTFREDLYFRLAVFELHVPPLRERPEDLVALARSFLARHAARSGRPLSMSEGAERALAAEAWPGNIRQLENAMVRLTVLAKGPTIEADEVAAILDPRAGSRAAPARQELPTLCLRDLERLAIDAALVRHGGNKSRAAEELGIALKTLYNKLNKFAAEEP